jgi:RecA/RadA recombinase
MSLIEAATFLASTWPVFACRADKKPATAHGFKDATRDPATIRAMFRRPGAALIGVPMGPASGLFAVDVDPRHGGEAWFEANAYRLPRTRTHRTMSGGWHLLFTWPEHRPLRNSASKIAPGVDTRGAGGYVITPPSDGYSIEDDAMPCEAPAWLLDLIDPPDEISPKPTKPLEYRAPAANEISSRYAEAALEGECRAVASTAEGGRNDRLNIAAVKLGSIVAAGALDRRTVEYELKRAAMHAGLDSLEAEKTIASGLGYGLTQPRQIPERVVSHQPPRRDTQGPLRVTDETQANNPTQLTDGGQPKHLPLLFLDDIQPCLDAADFVEGVLVEQGGAVVYGESNAGKTFFATDVALSVAAGQTWFGKEVDQGGVVYCVLEGGFGFRNRVRAWLDFNGQDNSLPFAAIPSSINLLDPAADTPRLIDAIREAAARFAMPVKLVVIDTLARAFAGGNENSSEDMGQLVLNMDAIRQATGACVLFIHHSGKDQAKGARGHSSLRAAIDTEIEVIANEDDGQVLSRVATVVKQRDLPKGEKFAFDLKVIELGLNRRNKPVTTCVTIPAELPEPDSQCPAMSGDVRRAFEVLCNLVADKGASGFGAPDGVRSVPEDWWRDRFYAEAKPGATQAAKQKAFRRAADALVGTKVVMENGRVWVA